MHVRDRAGDIHLLGAGEIVRLEPTDDGTGLWRVVRDISGDGEVLLFKGAFAAARSARDGLWSAINSGENTYDFEALENEADREREAQIYRLNLVPEQPTKKRASGAKQPRGTGKGRGNRKGKRS